MFKRSEKTVVLFICHYDADTHKDKRFVECTTVGAGKQYKNPKEFICEVQKMYTKFNNESTNFSRFTIENVVIE